jgi:Protein of unknown function (DUF2628)
MPTYTVHAPQLPRTVDASRATEQFVFVRDGFHFWAFALPPLWLLLHRLWLALLVYIVGYGVLAIGLALARVSSNVQLVVALLVALLMGFEASSIWRWALARRRWATLGLVVAEDAEIAERRFFAEWQKRAADEPPPPTEQKYSVPTRRGPPSTSDVIGLFPEPGGQR